MFWGTTKKKRGDEEKEKQIKELKQVFPSIRRPNNDDNLFEIKFVVNNQYSSLRVFIPGDFPSTRPVLQAAGPISHPWLDQFKQVNGSDKLMSWTRNSSLVEVVEESLSVLLTGTNQVDGTIPSGNTPYPAVAIPSAYPGAADVSQSLHCPAGAQDMAPNSGYSTYGNFSQQQGHSVFPISSSNNINGSSMYPNLDAAPATAATTSPIPAPMQRQSSGRMSLPELPSSFPELDKLTVVQLQRLLSDEVALEAHLAGVESIKAMQSVIEQVQQGNEEHARKNQSMETEVSTAAEEVEALQSALKVQVHEYQKRLVDAKKRCEVPRDTVLKELRTRKNDLDSKTEEMGADFVQGRVELSQFLAEFVEQRTRYHGLNAQLNIIG